MAKKYYYYFAYGMNTNAEQMKIRCPDAVPLGAAKLKNHRFDFKCHATVTIDKRDSVNGVLWMITDQDEDALDILEGFPKYYLKKVVKVEFENQLIDAMTYYIPGHESLFPPGDSYYDLVFEGYQKFGVPTHQLKLAKKRAENKNNWYLWPTLVDKNFDWL